MEAVWGYRNGASMDDAGDVNLSIEDDRSSKRRRLDNGGSHQAIYNGWQQQGLYGDAQYASTQEHIGSTYGPTTAIHALGFQYPDVSTYAQPYFHQQTDPATYTSSWPPIDNQNLGVADTYGSVAQGQTLPLQGEASASQSLFSQPLLESTTLADAYTVSGDSNGMYQDNITQIPQYTHDHHFQHQPVQPYRAGQPAFYFEDVSMHLKMQSLPILDNLASQLIHKIARASLSEIQDLIRSHDDEDGQAYRTLKNLFDQTRKVYSRETPFIDALMIQMFQPNQQEIIRKANIATFISSVLGAHDVSFFHLNEYFMETFVPLGHRLLKWQGAVYLELKTQTYISALMNSDGSPEPILDELFPPDLDAQILTRHPDAPSLSPSEQDFMDRCKARKSYLLREPANEDTAKELSQRYQWNDFVREFASAVTKNVDSILNIPSKTQQLLGGGSTDKRVTNAAQALQESAYNGQQLMAAQQAAMSGGATETQLNGQRQILPSPPSTAKPRDTSETRKPPANATNSTRHQWTKGEEEALLDGLDRVNGPHWSQILALYGRGGSLSEVLKDRNQVQLKDKARNLKLWYLKMGKEVPNSLRGVTGELRKRGGARAKAALGLVDEDDAPSLAENIVGNSAEKSKATSKGKAKARKR